MELCPPGWSSSALRTAGGGGQARSAGAGAGQFLHPKIESSQDVPIRAQKVAEWFLGSYLRNRTHDMWGHAEVIHYALTELSFTVWYFSDLSLGGVTLCRRSPNVPNFSSFHRPRGDRQSGFSLTKFPKGSQGPRCNAEDPVSTERRDRTCDRMRSFRPRGVISVQKLSIGSFDSNIL